MSRMMEVLERTHGTASPERVEKIIEGMKHEGINKKEIK